MPGVSVLIRRHLQGTTRKRSVVTVNNGSIGDLGRCLSVFARNDSFRETHPAKIGHEPTFRCLICLPQRRHSNPKGMNSRQTLIKTGSICQHEVYLGGGSTCLKAAAKSR